MVTEPNASVIRRVNRTVRSLLQPGRWSEAPWYYVSDLCYSYMPDLSAGVVLRALRPAFRAGALERRDTAKGVQVRRVTVRRIECITDVS